jgi:WXXGXW repeat (2 copies)
MPIRFVRALFFVLAVLCISAPLVSARLMAEVGVMVTIAPPPIPIYEQPVCPGDGYLWTPGYWAWDDGFDDYYWVPGTWILAPEVGFLWTPPYWAWNVDRFVFYDGYWGPTVGFYGGINYGFGYFGVGFEGGRWDNGHFFYNRAVLNVNVTEIHNVYNTRVNVNDNHVSFNGGNGGVNARPTPQEEAAAHERHIPAVAAQTQHVQEAHANPQLRASENKGRPPIAATARPGDFKTGVVETREAGGAYNPPANRGGNQPGAENRADNNVARPTTPGHVRDLPPAERPAAPNTGDAKLDKKYQQQQNKQYAQQQKERQNLAKQQEKEDQAVTKQNDQAKKQQVEQQHQQQTQQLQQRHQQQQQEMQQRVQSASRSKPPR